MSETFANEFEKWLEKNAGDAPAVVENDESCEESDNDSQHKVNTNIVIDYSDSEQGYHKQSLRNSRKLMSRSRNDQAPILVDDDDDYDDLLSKESLRFEDEPPVLEPISIQVPDYKITNMRIPQLSSQDDKCCNGKILHYERSSVNKNKHIKTYGSKKKLKHLTETGFESNKERFIKYKDQVNGSGYDNGKTEDCELLPPPLIPSPDALRLHSELTEYTQPKHSPNFCAMEADSTSEIAGDSKPNTTFCSQKQSKIYAQGEVSIECDSTCMLAASPLIVSPASVSNGEVDEIRDAGGGTLTPDVLNVELDSRKCKNLLCKKVENGLQLETMHSPTSLGSDVLSSRILTSDSHHRKSEMSQSGETQPYRRASVIKTSKYCRKLLSHLVQNEAKYTSPCEFSNEPPKLSAITPIQRFICQRNRHGIDNPEKMLQSRKRQCAKQTDFEYMSTPPKLTHIFETDFNLSSRKRSRHVSEHSNSSQSSMRRKKHSLNPNCGENASSFQKDVTNFTRNMCQLSQLQTNMHILLYQLFPHLRVELDCMSPESPWFKKLLSRLIRILQQPSLQIEDQNIPHSPNDSDNEILQKSEISSPRILNLKYTSQTPTYKLSSSSPKGYTASNIEINTSLPELECSTPQQVGSSNTTTLYNFQKHVHLVKKHNYSLCPENDIVIPHISQMTLRDMGEYIRPSKVLLCKNSDILLLNFIDLSCRALKLLLPNLTIDLCSEFAAYPCDLIIFINNVILANSER